MLYNSNDLSSENLLLDQLIIPNWYFFLISSLVCLKFYGYCREEFCLGLPWELKGLPSVEILWSIYRYFILQILLWNLWKKKIKNTRLCSVRSLWNIAPIYIACKSGKSCHNYWLYGHHLQQTLINIHITSIQFTTILFIGMRLCPSIPMMSA